MSLNDRLGTDYFARPARIVARDLLGKLLVRRLDQELVSCMIVETEAYCDGVLPDLACHGDRTNKGKPTDRTEVMFGPAGIAYVYFTYGMHWMFNIVTGENGRANAVLIRAAEPVFGQSIIARYRPGRQKKQWTNGPAKLAQSLAIDKSLNGTNLCHRASMIWLEYSYSTQAIEVQSGPRVGLGNTPEPWLSIPWRFWIKGNSFVSK